MFPICCVNFYVGHNDANISFIISILAESEACLPGGSEETDKLNNFLICKNVYTFRFFKVTLLLLLLNC